MWRQNLLEALRNLTGARQRTLLALIGIVIGTGSVIALINIGTIAQHEALRQFRALGTNLIVVSIVGEVTATTAQVESMVAALDRLQIAAPMVNGAGMAKYQGRPMNASVVGTTEAFCQIVRCRLADGRFVDRLDGYESYVALGAKLAEEITQAAGKPPALLDTIGVGSALFTVVGILEQGDPNPLIPVAVDQTLFVPLKSVRRLATEPGIRTILARLTDDQHVPEATAAIQDYLSEADPRIQTRILTAAQLIAQIARQNRLYTLLLGAVGSISLVVGGVGVMNVMLVSVTERRPEIGIRMALGARRRDIRTLFLIESVILSIVGGLIGTAIGVGASLVMAQQSGWSFVLSPLAIPLGAGVAAAVGVFFGFYPAVLASRLNIVDALRDAT